jgi:XTP/dITP diphosphohydrolase
MPPPVIVLATRNAGKVREFAALLAELPVKVASLDQVDPRRQIAEPAEEGGTFAENARHKAAYYARATGSWALADDSGLKVDALEGAPGVYSARFAAQECPPGASREVIDQANNARLLRLLKDVSDPRRTARFVCHLVLHDGRRLLIETTGVFEGRIGYTPAGGGGFGYDPLFFLPQLGCTSAQLPPRRKNRLSHRGQAARQLALRLRELLEGGPGPVAR